MLPLLVLPLLLSQAVPASPALSFDYDRSAPLDLQTLTLSNRDGVSVTRLTFSVSGSDPAEALLVVPAGLKGRTGAIIWVHSGGMFQNLPDAVLMAQAGAISLCLDPGGSPAEDPKVWRDNMIATVIRIRRAVDVLIARPDVDSGRIAYAGHSFGAMIGVDALAVDQRFRAAVFEAGLLGMSIHIGTSPHPWPQSVRKALGGGLGEFLQVIEPLDASHFIARLPPIPLLFQSARLDPGVPEKDSIDFFRAASQPKQLLWYDSGHDIADITAISDRARFLARHLKLAPSEPLLRRKMGLERNRE